MESPVPAVSRRAIRSSRVVFAPSATGVSRSLGPEQAENATTVAIAIMGRIIVPPEAGVSFPQEFRPSVVSILWGGSQSHPMSSGFPVEPGSSYRGQWKLDQANQRPNLIESLGQEPHRSFTE